MRGRAGGPAGDGVCCAVNEMLGFLREGWEVAGMHAFVVDNQLGRCLVRSWRTLVL